jgi:hypothetical protein
MFPSWRTKIREARRALDAGRPDEASELLQRESVREFLPAKQLSEEVAAHLAERAQRRLVIGESSAGWQDLHLAAQMGGCEEQISELRQAYTDRSLQRIRHFLACGETALASQQIKKLEQRRLGGDRRRIWKLVVELISQAKKLAREGEATAAVNTLDRAKSLLPDSDDAIAEHIVQRQDQLRNQAVRIGQLSSQLHEAVGQQAWNTVLSLAESLLELAPEHRSSRQARRLAWKAVGLDATGGRRESPPTELYVGKRRGDRLSPQTTRNGFRSAHMDTKTTERPPGKRQVARIDGVGGYKICLDDDVTLGQPTAPPNVDIPILADLSRRHASLRRDGESYVLTPVHRVSVDGAALSGPTVLNSGALIELGDNVRIRFRRPHALSATAVLTLESHHKTEPAVDSIVLMSDSCILGSQSHSHICCRNWTDELVFFRRGEGLTFRTSATVEVDGQPTDSQILLPENCRLEAENFAMSLEDL